MPHNVVILGSGYSAVPLAHSLLKHTPATAPITVYLVSPTDHFYFHNASVRGVLPGAIPDSALMYPIADAFAQYPASRFRYIKAAASSVDPDRKTVTLSAPALDGKDVLAYDSLVIGTGSHFAEDMPFKNLASTKATKARLQKLREEISEAKNIVVAGAGMTGTEVAGELGAAYSSNKTITLISDDDLPLTKEFLPSVRKILATQLNNVGVKLIPSSRVIKSEQVGSQTQLTLRSKTGDVKTINTDLYIPAFGVVPNTSFLPASMVDKSRRVKTRLTMQAEGYDDIFAMGDVANLQSATVKHADEHWRAVAPNLTARILNEKATMKPLKKDDTVVAAVTVGPSGGTGQLGSFRFPSLMVWWIKSKNYGVEKVGPWARGEKTLMQKV